MQFDPKVAQAQNLSFEQWHTPIQITNGDLAALVHTIGLFVKEEMAKAVVPLARQEELEPLKARLEEMAPFVYRGVWKEGEQYHAGNFTTVNGSLWHANCSTKSRPGEDHVAWTLAVKHGANGRDGKNASEPSHTEARKPTRPRTGGSY